MNEPTNPQPTTNERATRVFLSYARGDDEPFVRRLHDDLTAAGFQIWFDKSEKIGVCHA